MTDHTIRTPGGAFLSFDMMADGFYTLNIFGESSTRHLRLSAANMEELIEAVGVTYYGAEQETEEQQLVRLMKQAIAEDREEMTKALRQ